MLKNENIFAIQIEFPRKTIYITHTRKRIVGSHKRLSINTKEIVSTRKRAELSFHTTVCSWALQNWGHSPHPSLRTSLEMIVKHWFAIVRSLLINLRKNVKYSFYSYFSETIFKLNQLLNIFNSSFTGSSGDPELFLIVQYPVELVSSA